MPTLSAHQTQYLPYPGVFQKLFQSDVFVFQDDVQYVKQEFQNRNRIRTADGWRWLTLPVKYSSTATIAQVFPADTTWKDKHARTVGAHYAKSTYLGRLDLLWEIAEKHKADSLSTIGFKTGNHLAQIINPEAYTNVQIILESDLKLTAKETSTPTKRLIALCKRLGCDRYISGSGGKSYLDISAWEKAGIELVWQDFTLKPYTQQFPGWEPNLSSIDLILNEPDPYAHLMA